MASHDCISKEFPSTRLVTQHSELPIIQSKATRISIELEEGPPWSGLVDTFVVAFVGFLWFPDLCAELLT